MPLSGASAPQLPYTAICSPLTDDKIKVVERLKVVWFVIGKFAADGSIPPDRRLNLSGI
jgi:hypothetical protein